MKDTDYQVEEKNVLELRGVEHYLSKVPESKYTIVEYFDYDCPFCRKLHLALDNEVVDYSKINYILRSYPATDVGVSPYKSLIGECVYLQNGDEGYVSFLDGYYRVSGDPKKVDWAVTIAKNIVADDGALDKCLVENEEVKNMINSNYLRDSLDGGIKTPSYFVYKDGVLEKKFVGLGAKLYVSLIEHYSK